MIATDNDGFTHVTYYSMDGRVLVYGSKIEGGEGNFRFLSYSGSFNF